MLSLSKSRANMKKAIKLFFILGLFCLFFIAVNGQSRKELEKLRTKKEKEIAVTKKKLEETKKKKEKSEEVLTTLREQISQKRELAGMYTKEVEKIDVEIEGLNCCMRF